MTTNDMMQGDGSYNPQANDLLDRLLANSGLSSADGLFVGNMMSGSANHQQHLGVYISDWVGLRHAEAFHIEAACGSGSAAFRSALIDTPVVSAASTRVTQSSFAARVMRVVPFGG